MRINLQRLENEARRRASAERNLTSWDIVREVIPTDARALVDLLADDPALLEEKEREAIVARLRGNLYHRLEAWRAAGETDWLCVRCLRRNHKRDTCAACWLPRI